MTDVTNYGISVGYSLTSGSVYNTIASLYNISVPKIMQAEVESTNHGTNGKRTFIPGGLTEIGEWKMSIGYDGGETTGSIIGWVQSGTNLYWKITMPNTDVWQFQGFIKEFSPSDFDSTAPALHMADVTIRSTGSLTLS